jgi:hypothetical protein
MKIVHIVIRAYVKDESDLEDTIDDSDIKILHDDVVGYGIVSAKYLASEETDDE